MMSGTSELTTYEAARQRLIQEDRARRADHRRGPLSDLETKADAIVRKIRAEEAATIWKEDHPTIPHPFPGMEFLTGKSIIVQTKLFKILSKMPKGGLLHAHTDATVDVTKLLQLGLKEPAMHVRAPERITNENITTALPSFLALPPESYALNEVSVTDPSYKGETWVQIQTARSAFDPELGGPEGFDKWVVGALTLNPSEAYGTHNTVDKIWQKFTSTFRCSEGLIHYIPIYQQYIREFFRSSVEDGISYVEPRVNFWRTRGLTMIDDKGRADFSHRDLLVFWDEAVKDVKAELEQNGRGDEFVGAKIIYSTLRFITPDDLVWYMEDCIKLKKEFPHLIAGFDLVGQEDINRPLSYYMEQLLWFRHRQKEAGVDIPYLLHAGETLGDGTEADMNLYDAILLGTKRIGHGFSLVKHPRLMEICREREIALEVCPISNEILRLTSSMPMHPLPILFNHGVSVALCSDDPSAFGSMGLSYDYYQVIAASEVTGLLQLGEVARDSLKYSMLEPEEKQAALDIWERKWLAFLESIVKEYGDAN